MVIILQNNAVKHIVTILQNNQISIYLHFRIFVDRLVTISIYSKLFINNLILIIMLESLKAEVCEANHNLLKYGLVMFSWGNVSAIDHHTGYIVIKPSGVPYETLKPEHMVVVNREGKVIEGKLKPSSDTATHIVLYKSFPEIGSIAHAQSTYATAWAQAGIEIPIIGATHADYFAGSIPCTRIMTQSEVEGDYEYETGKVIVECFKGLNPRLVPGVLVTSRGPFAWGEDAHDALQNAVAMEQCAQMASIALAANPNLKMNPHLVKKHFYRKHGPGAYYGQ